MDCSNARSLFDTYLDGELSGSLAAELAAHQLQCASCRRELALLEVSGHVLATDTSTPGLDAEFTERLVACALVPAPRRFPARRMLAVVGVPLATAACLLFAFSRGGDDAAATDEYRRTRVLDSFERMDTPEELLAQVEKAREVHPESAELEALEVALRAKIDEIAGDTEEQAKLLESFGKMTIMEILESMPFKATPQETGQPPDPAASGASGDEHDPPVADS